MHSIRAVGSSFAPFDSLRNTQPYSGLSLEKVPEIIRNLATGSHQTCGKSFASSERHVEEDGRRDDDGECGRTDCHDDRAYDGDEGSNHSEHDRPCRRVVRTAPPERVRTRGAEDERRECDGESDIRKRRDAAGGGPRHENDHDGPTRDRSRRPRRGTRGIAPFRAVVGASYRPRRVTAGRRYEHMNVTAALTRHACDSSTKHRSYDGSDSPPLRAASLRETNVRRVPKFPPFVCCHAMLYDLPYAPARLRCDGAAQFRRPGPRALVASSHKNNSV